MKLQYKNIVAVLAMAISFVSCSKDDSGTNEVIQGNGKITLEFDNTYKGANLVLDAQNSATSTNENLKVSTLKYIVSNIKLVKEDGSVFTYPKAKSYFIVDETEASTHNIVLTDVPTGNYVAIKYGIGVDKEQYDLGATGQGDFLALAQKKNMIWTWSTGYRFLMFEGKFTSATVAADTKYMIHTGKTGTDYNYTELTLPLPEKAIVRNTNSSVVHIMADASKIIDGTNKISLTDNNMGTGAMIMGGTNLPKITSNLSEMFKVNHVHN